MALSGDFIVGFPGETEAEFEATLQLVDAVGYASAFSFKYSARPGTPAAALPGQVAEPVKAERLARLQARLAAHTRTFSASCVGRRLPVLLEKRGRQAGQLIGRSPLSPGRLDRGARGGCSVRSWTSTSPMSGLTACRDAWHRLQPMSAHASRKPPIRLRMRRKASRALPYQPAMRPSRSA